VSLYRRIVPPNHALQRTALRALDVIVAPRYCVAELESLNDTGYLPVMTKGTRSDIIFT
jgi:hypothetical protein